MRKAYQKPCAKRVHFNFEKVVAASGCKPWTVVTVDVSPCSSMTPNDPYVRAASLTSEPCGEQKNQN